MEVGRSAGGSVTESYYDCTLTTRDDAFPCSYTRRAEPTKGKLDILDTKAGEFGLGSGWESRRWGEEGDGDRCDCEVDAIESEL
jgi:hypothetical protein